MRSNYSKKRHWHIPLIILLLVFISGCIEKPVGNTNMPPVLDTIGDKTINEENTLTFTISASDSDNDSLTYLASNLPSGATFNAVTRTFSWTPTYAKGSYQIAFAVNDGSLSDSETITIIVEKPAEKPAEGPVSKSGDGAPVYVPDGYVATNVFSSALVAPWDLDFGPDGDLYIAEFTGSRVSKLTSDGSLSTYVEIPESFRGHAISIAFNSSGDLYVVINRLEGDGILKIFPNQTVTTFANSFSSYTELSGGLGQLAIGPSGDIFVTGADKIFRITPDGVVTTFASGLSFPSDLEFGPSGDLFVLGSGGEIKRIMPNGTKTVFVPRFSNSNEFLYFAFDVQGNILVSDGMGGLYRVTPDGTVIPLEHFPDQVPGFYDDMIFDSSGNLYVADGTGSRIIKVFSNNTASVLVDGFMSTGLAVGPSGDIYAINTASIQGDPPSTDIIKVSPDKTSATFATVSGTASDIDFDTTGVLYVAVFDGGIILKIHSNGEASTFVTGLHNPGRLAFGQSGDLFVLESYNGTVLRITPEGEISTLATGFGDVTTGSLYGGLAVDPVGNVFVGSMGGNNTIYEIFPNGTVTTFASDVSDAGFWNYGDIAICPGGEIFAEAASRLYRITQDEVTLFATDLTNDAHSITCSSSGELFIGRAGSIVKISDR